MSQAEKLRKRFLALPANFTWDEVVTLLGHFGFVEKSENGGSHRCFINEKGEKLFVAKPHPQKIVKRYALRQVKSKLEQFGYL